MSKRAAATCTQTSNRVTWAPAPADRGAGDATPVWRHLCPPVSLRPKLSVGHAAPALLSWLSLKNIGPRPAPFSISADLNEHALRQRGLTAGGESQPSSTAPLLCCPQRWRHKTWDSIAVPTRPWVSRRWRRSNRAKNLPIKARLDLRQLLRSHSARILPVPSHRTHPPRA
eukprot:354396-Chlamydomonas_euryale.AAC.4